MAPDAPSDALDVALRVARACDAMGVQYFLGGSLASSLQGEPRATNDIDFVVALPASRVEEFAAALGDDFEVDRDILRDAIQRGSSANIYFLPLVIKIDLFALGAAPFDREEFQRRRGVPVKAGETLVVKSPEDSVLRKLLWFVAGGRVSERQWRDVLAVLRVGGAKLDRDYLDRWAGELGITAELDAARGQSG